MTLVERHNTPPSSSYPSVMLIDDDAEVVEVIRQAVKMIGYDIQTFASGEEAIKMYPHLKSSVVIIDLGLRGANGLEVAKQLKEIPPGDRASLILISGSVTEKIIMKAEAIGFTHVLPKPFAIPKLLQLLKELFAIHSIEQN